MRLMRAFTVAGVFLLALSFVVVAGGARQVPSRAAAAKQQRHPDVTGDYYFGDGLGVNCSLTISKSNTFAFRWTGCLGEYDKNSGSFEWQGDLIVMHPQRPNNRDGFRGMSTRFYPVKWDSRMYLVAEEQMLGFCHKFSKGWRGEELLGRSDTYYRRYPAGKMAEKGLGAAKGQPGVPAMYRSILRDGFTATACRSPEAGKIMIDKGSASGVSVGTMLTGKGWNWLRVVKVGENEATCELWDKKDSMPAPGTKLVPVDI